MPEGDTIHRAANRLRPALLGQPVVKVELPRNTGPLPAAGEVIEAVRAHGKHLLIDFSGGLTLRVHLRMTGSWHLYRTGSTWQRSPRTARVIIDVPGWTAVCFNAPDVAVTPSAKAAVTHLGPDLCDPNPDFAAICERARTSGDGDRSVGEVVMDQRVASGIGNVYKSEVLHAVSLDPTTPIASVPTDTLRTVFATAHDLLRSNIERPGARQTVREGYAVYRRDGQSCRRCGGVIERILQGGDQPRSTYFCPGCQVRP